MNTEVEDIKSRLSIREVIGGYVQLAKAGVNWKGLCPFHHEKTPSFIVNEERSSWHCFGCGKGGDVFSFIMELDGLSFPEALALLAERAGVELSRPVRRGRVGQAGPFEGEMISEGAEGVSEHSSADISKARIVELVQLSSKFFEKQLWEGTGAKTVLPYLRDRGLSNESIRAFRLGYALPGWRTLADFLAKRGFSPEEMEAGGVVIRKEQQGARSKPARIATPHGGVADGEQGTRNNEQGAMNKEQGVRSQQSTVNSQQESGNTEREVTFQTSNFQLPTSGLQLPTTDYQLPTAHYDRFRNRITFPIFDIAGRVIGFSARVLPGADESSAKYINTPETILYHKSRSLYGLFQAKRALRDEGVALFVEGNMDVIAMHQAGFPNTVAVSGTALTEEQLRIVRRFADRLSLFFDMDSAGQKAARKSAELALALGFSVHMVAIEGGKDAAELAREDKAALRRAIAEALPAPEYFLRATVRTNDTKTAEGKRRIAEDIGSLVRFVARDIERLHWVKVVAERIGIAEDAFLRLMMSLPAHNFSEDARREEVSAKISPDKKSTVSFEVGSERISRDIAGLVLAFPFLLPLPVESASERVLEALSRSDMLSFLSDETDADAFSFSRIPESLKNEGAALAFHGEKLAGVEGAPERADRDAIVKLFETLWGRLHDETRREAMRDIERAMRAAHEAGDRDEERRLAGELVALGKE